MGGGKVSKSPESVRSPESGVRSSEGRAKQESRVTSYKSQSGVRSPESRLTGVQSGEPGKSPDSGLRTPDSGLRKVSPSKTFQKLLCFVYVSFHFVRFNLPAFHFPESGMPSEGGCFRRGPFPEAIFHLDQREWKKRGTFREFRVRSPEQDKKGDIPERRVRVN